MGYRRKARYPRRRPRPPRTWRKNMSNVKTLANYAYKGYQLAKYVKSLVNVEYKNLDVSQATTATTTASLWSISNIPQGIQVEQREGDSVKLKSITARIRLSSNASSTLDFQYARLIMFVDKDNNNPGTTDPTAATTAAYKILEADTVESHLFLDNASRYHVLLDKVVTLTEGGKEYYFEKYYKPMDMKIQFDGTATEPAKKNNVWIYIVGSEATNGPNFSINTRIRYVDN